MVKQPQEDLFADTTMSFGDHIEELRGSLAKALYGLIGGFLLGMLVASWVVGYIQTPLKKALENHYIQKAEADLSEEYARQGEDISPQVMQFIREKGFVYEKVFVEAAEVPRVADIAAEAAAGRFGSASDAAEPSADSKPPAEMEPAADDGSNSDTEPANDTKPNVESDATNTAEVKPAAPSVVILGEPLPAPQAVMITTRVWRPVNTVVKALNAQEAFMIWLKASFVAGLVISSPWMFWHIWAFVAAGLYPHEKRYVFVYLPFSMFLFLAGAATAFFFVFEYVLDFLFTFNKMMNIDPDPRISEWLSFVLILPLGFGVAFQLPLVMLFMHRIGIFTIAAYLDKWRMAVLVIFVISMLLTPADPISMLLMACPLTFLYFLGIALCKWMPRNRNPFSEVYEP